MNISRWILVSGLVWFVIGIMLLWKGLSFLSDSLADPRVVSSEFGRTVQGANSLVAAGLVLGFLKGRFVLSKTVRRTVRRLIGLPEPISLKNVYAPSYYLIIAGMMSLGFLFKFLPIPVDLRGCLDIAIGSALVHGALLYFRCARLCDKNCLDQFLELGKSVQSKSASSSDV